MTNDWQSLGDSHTRGYAGEMLCNVKPLCKITGYLIPSQELLELLNTDKEEIRKSTTRDTFFMVEPKLFREIYMGKV